MRAEASQLVAALRKTIEDFAEDFRGGGAFNFATEADVQSTLLGRLRANVLFNVRVRDAKVELVHAEFPAFGVSWQGGARHDLTVWHPDFADEARRNYGIPIRRWPEVLRQRLNLIAVELKRFPGLPWGIKRSQMFSENAQSVVDRKVREHPDIRKLKESWCELGYFLIFWDDDVATKPSLEDLLRIIAQGMC